MILTTEDKNERIVVRATLETLASLWVDAALARMRSSWGWFNHLLRWFRKSPAPRDVLVEDLADALNKVFDAGRHLTPRRREVGDPTHYYVYSFRDGSYVYERTCGTEQAAAEWVKKLGKNATFTINTTIREAFY